MAHLKDIKERIDSVKKTRKMTQAMKMVAAAKFKRYSQLAVASRLIIDNIDTNISRVTHYLHGLVDVDLMQDVKADKELLLVVAGDRGLCGGFNSHLLKRVHQYIENSPESLELILFGRKAIQYFQNKEVVVVKTYENFCDDMSVSTIDTLLNQIIQYFYSQRYASISIVYNEFKTALTSNLINKQLLPVKWSDQDDVELFDDLILEPSDSEVLMSLCRMYISHSFNNIFLESFAAEQGARMAAMDSATDNAGEMIKELTLKYNRQRQAQITTELSEIVAGSEALMN